MIVFNLFVPAWQRGELFVKLDINLQSLKSKKIPHHLFRLDGESAVYAPLPPFIHNAKRTRTCLPLKSMESLASPPPPNCLVRLNTRYCASCWWCNPTGLQLTLILLLPLLPMLTFLGALAPKAKRTLSYSSAQDFLFCKQKVPESVWVAAQSWMQNNHTTSDLFLSLFVQHIQDPAYISNLQTTETKDVGQWWSTTYFVCRSLRSNPWHWQSKVLKWKMRTWQPAELLPVLSRQSWPRWTNELIRCFVSCKSLIVSSSCST